MSVQCRRTLPPLSILSDVFPVVQEASEITVIFTIIKCDVLKLSKRAQSSIEIQLYFLPVDLSKNPARLRQNSTSRVSDLIWYRILEVNTRSIDSCYSAIHIISRTETASVLPARFTRRVGSSETSKSLIQYPNLWKTSRIRIIFLPCKMKYCRGRGKDGI